MHDQISALYGLNSLPNLFSSEIPSTSGVLFFRFKTSYGIIELKLFLDFLVVEGFSVEIKF